MVSRSRSISTSLCVLTSLLVYGGGPARPQNGDIELVVFCDVSNSLDLPTILSEADVVFQFIHDDVLFPSGTFMIYIADRDVVRNEVMSDRKFVMTRKNRELDQSDRLDQLRDGLREKLSEYCTRRPIRDRTCLVKAFRSAPMLFSAGSTVANRRLLVVSDMLEDCDAQGDPKTPKQLQQRIKRSLAQSELDMSGQQILAAIVSSSQRPLDIADLLTVWGPTLKNARFSIGPPNVLLRNAPATH